MAATFTADDVAAIRAYCEMALCDDAATIVVSERDHGACVGLIVELLDGHKVGSVAVANGREDARAGIRLVNDVRRRMTG